jgi:hypothetical protein
MVSFMAGVAWPPPHLVTLHRCSVPFLLIFCTTFRAFLLHFAVGVNSPGSVARRGHFPKRREWLAFPLDMLTLFGGNLW